MCHDVLRFVDKISRDGLVQTTEALKQTVRTIVIFEENLCGGNFSALIERKCLNKVNDEMQ